LEEANQDDAAGRWTATVDGLPQVSDDGAQVVQGGGGEPADDLAVEGVEDDRYPELSFAGADPLAERGSAAFAALM
jgi:hypothetical protein